MSFRHRLEKIKLHSIKCLHLFRNFCSRILKGTLKEFHFLWILLVLVIFFFSNDSPKNSVIFFQRLLRKIFKWFLQEFIEMLLQDFSLWIISGLFPRNSRWKSFWRNLCLNSRFICFAEKISWWNLWRNHWTT